MLQERLEASILNPFVESVILTMDIMCKIKASRFCIGMKDKGQVVPGDISGMIGFTGDLKGLIALTFPTGLAVQAVSNMIGEQLSDMNLITHDGIAEVTNITSGHAKGKLKGNGFNIAMSLPSIIIGTGHCISTPIGINSVLVGFQTPIAPFWLEIALRKQEEQS